jgi:hypothetical protein
MVCTVRATIVSKTDLQLWQCNTFPLYEESPKALVILIYWAVDWYEVDAIEVHLEETHLKLVD